MLILSFLFSSRKLGQDWPHHGYSSHYNTISFLIKHSALQWPYSSPSPPSSSLFLLSPSLPFTSAALFSEYIGAQFNGVKFTDVPINPGVDFHFILAFAIDYTTGSSPTSTNGNFSPFWDTGNLSPSQVSAIKRTHSNVKVALSLGGDSVAGQSAFFNPTSMASWVANAVPSLTRIIQQYNLDGIDIDYEHFQAGPGTFAECIGQTVRALKNNGIISFASIAPFDDSQVQSHYMELWRRFPQLIDYVNFQFYAYDASTTVSQFLGHFNTQSSNYPGGKVIASFSTDSSGGLKPNNGFFTALNSLKNQGKLNGIFVWSADDSLKDGFRYEKQAQSLLA